MSNQSLTIKNFGKLQHLLLQTKPWKMRESLLLKKKKVISEDVKKVEIFNEYFGNIAKKLGTTEIAHIGDSIRNVWYKNHPSIVKLKMKMDSTKTFFLIMLALDTWMS